MTPSHELKALDTMKSSRCLKVWEDGGRKFKLEYRSNEAGRFLLRFVRDVEAKKYCLIFLDAKV